MKKFQIYSMLIFEGELKSKIDLSSLGWKFKEISDNNSLLAIQMMDSLNIWSLTHIESAVWHSLNAFQNNHLISKTFSIELLLYLAGERQISKAIEEYGLKENTRCVLGVIIGTNQDKILNAFNELLFLYDLELHKNILNPTEEKYEYFSKKLIQEGFPRNKLSYQGIESMLLQKIALLALG